MRRRGLVLLASLLAVAACQGARQAPLTEQHRAAMADSVRLLAESFADAMSNRLDRDLQSFYDSTPGAVMVSDGRIVALGWDSLAARYRGWSPPDGAAFEWTRVVVEPLAPGVAHLAGLFRESLTTPSGPAYEGTGAATAVAVHRPSGWVFAAFHVGLVPAPSQGR